MVAADLDLLELGERAQPHVEDRVGLKLGEVEGRHQLGLRIVGLPDDADDLVDVEERDQQAVEDLEPPHDRGEAMVGAALDDLASMVEPVAQRVLQAEHDRRLAAHQHVHVERDAGLELGELEDRLHHNDRVDLPRPRLQHEADLVGRLVADVDDQRQFAVVDELGDALDQPALRHEIGNLGHHHDPGPAPEILDLPARAGAERAAAGAVALGDHRG